MALTPPPVGRPARLPEWDGAKLSSLRDFLARQRVAVAGYLPFIFDSATQAEQVIRSDGAVQPAFFGVSDDPAVYSMTTGKAVRIGPGLKMTSPTVVRFVFAAGSNWSGEVSVPIDLDGQIPHFVSLTPMAEDGAYYDLKPKLVYSAGASNPDWTASRVKCAARLDPASSVEITRYALFAAFRGE